MTQLKKVESNESYQIVPTTFKELTEYAQTIARSDLAPKDFKGKPENILIAVQMGAEVGLKPMQALQNIAVINGRPCLWGDSMLAIVKSHPEFEWIKETVSNNVATCIIKRKGQPEHQVQFGVEDAKKAGLWTKTGPWSQYPNRMLQMRARSFAVRDAFPDALKGLSMAEEVRDYPQEKIIPHEEPTPTQAANYPSHDEIRQEYLEKIQQAETMEDLKKNYKEAFRWATHQNDAEFLNVITDAKEAKKFDLELDSPETQEEQNHASDQ